MKLGVGLPAAGAWATPENLARVARRAEALGYHSLWVFRRLLYPVAPQDEDSGAPGGAWPDASIRTSNRAAPPSIPCWP